MLAAPDRGSSRAGRFSGVATGSLAALALLALGSLSAVAQSGEVRGARPGSFDFYVLALSWSSGFCETSGDRRGNPQCDTGRGLDFVVHGLWPQYENGYPTECGAERFIPRSMLERARGVFPDERLARYEWRKHGTCSGRSPGAYFDDARAARDKVTIPEKFKNLGRDLTIDTIEIERAFAAANEGLRSDMMAVVCQRGILQEVRICFDRDLKGFRTCPQVNRNACRVREVTVPAVR